MHIFDVFEAWLCSMERQLVASGVAARFDCSSVDRSDPSWCLNLRRNDEEADLLIWESGQAELAVGVVDGSVSQLHFDDMRNRADLALVLSKLSEFVVNRAERH